MEAPEKIYIEPNLDSIWGMAERSCESEIEYTRTDAFIDKVCKWLSNMPIEDMEYKYDNFDTSEGWYRMIDELREYLKK